MPKNVESAQFDSQRILDTLRTELKAAQERRDSAFKRYAEALRTHNARRNGHGTDALRRAYFEYNRSQQEVLDAVVKLNAHLLKNGFSQRNHRPK
ncbi:MAG: hypothetical protein JWO19_4769 [Bryobacterales bacterium]|jgi:hypothetical protein|nr:hypothetical protein [Bryobacterales bacterium]